LRIVGRGEQEGARNRAAIGMDVEQSRTGRVNTFSTSPLPDRIARAAIWGKQSGRLSNMIKSTPASPIPYHNPYPPCHAMPCHAMR
jgi:hypothetical protein